MSKPRKLSNLKINAIALVGKAANRRKFLLFKSKDKIKKEEDNGGEPKMAMTVDELKQMLDTMIQKMDEILGKVNGVKPPNKNPDDEINNEDVMKQVKEIVTDENIAILKGAIDLLEKAEQTSQEKNKKGQEDRSKKYNIAIKEGGSVTKPTEYEKLTDEQFADPVNYSYPIDKDHVLAAYKYFAQADNQKVYSEEEKKIIWNKIIDALPNDIQEEAKKIAGITKEDKSKEEVVSDEIVNEIKKINDMLK